MDSATRKEVQERAISVWIRADLNLLVSRTGRRNGRPLLNNGDRREILQRLIEERHPIYGQADVVIDSARENPDITVNRLIGFLKKFTEEKALSGATE